MVRCFLAISFSEAVKRRLQALQEELARSRADVRWVRPEGMHLTLKFFGNVPEENIPLLVEAARKVVTRFAPLHLRLKDLGAFPSVRRPRVVWVGLTGDVKELARLQQQLEQAFAALEYTPEDRRFVPHVTLGRVKSARRLARLQELMAKCREAVGKGWEEIQVTELVLYKSTLKPSGAVYTPLAVIPLEEDSPQG